MRYPTDIGRVELPPCAVMKREHPDRLSTLINFIDDPINVRLFAVEQVPQFSLNFRASGATGQR
jgi:hypothetical protein